MTFAPSCVLVTGGAGFIGSNFIRWMLGHARGLQVINVDPPTYAGHLEGAKALPSGLYTWAARPAGGPGQTGLPWSSTWSQSRTFRPFPYTGRDWSGRARVIIKGMSFSGNWYGP